MDDFNCIYIYHLLHINISTLVSHSLHNVYSPIPIYINTHLTPSTIGIEMMAQHPEWQTKLLEEMHRVLDGKSPEDAKAAAEAGLALPGARIKELYTYDKIMDLTLLRCFLMEGLRLYTPSTSVAPRATTKEEGSKLGDFNIPKGTNVMCNFYG